MAGDSELTNLIADVFGRKMWHSTSLLETAKVDSLGTMIHIGYALLAGLLIFQLVVMVLNISRSERVWENLGPVVYRAIILALLISPPVYTLIFRYTIAGATNTIANAIFSDYVKDFLASWQNIFQAQGDSPIKPWDVLSAEFATSLVTNVISSVIFLAAVIVVFVVTMLQPYIWLFAYWVGPICIAFGMFDITTHIAKNWLNMFLQANFVGVFGSLAFVVAQSAGLVGNFGAGTAASNIILVAVYGLLSIVFFCMIWPMTAYLFSGSSQLGQAGSPAGVTGAAATGVSTAATAAVLYGGGMSAMGSMFSRMGGDSGLGKMGQGMVEHGTKMKEDASDLKARLRGVPLRSSGPASGHSRGSTRQTSSIHSDQGSPLSSDQRQNPQI
jgi:hypothetical protein